MNWHFSAFPGCVFFAYVRFCGETAVKKALRSVVTAALRKAYMGLLSVALFYYL